MKPEYVRQLIEDAKGRVVVIARDEWQMNMFRRAIFGDELDGGSQRLSRASSSVSFLGHNGPVLWLQRAAIDHGMFETILARQMRPIYVDMDI